MSLPNAQSPKLSPYWNQLEQLAQQAANWSMREVFRQAPTRQKDFTTSHNGLSLDLSQTQLSDPSLDALITLLYQDQNFEAWRTAMFEGQHINHTEDRAVLHTALRIPRKQTGESTPLPYEDKIKDKIALVHDTLGKMEDFTREIHSPPADKPQITDIVNIGIGGSSLGPEMAYKALRSHHKKGIRVHYVSNVDGHDLYYTLQGLSPENTLFLVASKTFTTQETMANATEARKWLTEALGESAVGEHFAALSTNIEAATNFGISSNRVFPFWDWVGGRFSLWSSIGLSLCLGLGFDKFEELLAGAHDMDKHFYEAPPKENLPVLLALTGIWNRNFMGHSNLAVLPYDQRLERFPAFLQQLDMESNGKFADRNGVCVDYATGPTLYGEPGTNGQHAFYQHLQQSNDITPCEFITIENPDHPYHRHHNTLLKNAAAQALALMNGRTLEEAGGDIYRVFSGNRPSSTLNIKCLTPYHLGQLLALYEHKTSTQGIFWAINSYDQYGVELGKELAKTL